MKCNEPHAPFSVRRTAWLSLLIAAASLLALTAARAAVTLTIGDALNTSSFNAAGNWSEALAPHTGTNYEVSVIQLRTPASTGSFSFLGDSLTILGGGQFTYKGAGTSGTITVSNLVLNGGTISHLAGAGDLFQLAGNLNVVTGSGIHAKQGPITVNALISGNGTITNPGADGPATLLMIANSANTFTGSFVNHGRFTLSAGANMNFVIGASNVNNRVSGTGAATLFDGRFLFDLTGASTNAGSSWTIASASAQTFGSTFSVDGFGRVGGGAGPGSWEVVTNGTVYSFDTGSGILQVVTGSSTNTNAVLNSQVAFLRHSVVATDACLMPSSATYGRAINGISFQNNNILVTLNGYQYTAWYDTVGTSQFIWLARRAVTNASVGAWETFLTDSEFLNGDESSWDAHNVIALGICPADGTLHLSWDHHNHTLKYRRSIAGLCTTNKAAWGPGMLNAQQNWLVASGQTITDVTYPQFTITPTGGLVLNRRVGSSGNGDQLFYNYIPISGATGGYWATQTLFLSRTGTYNGSVDRNAYINGLDFGPDGKLHVTWTWRETASSANHDICYAYSSDHGVTWRNNAGTTVANTSLGESINLDTPGIIIQPLDTQQLIINQQAQCVDNDGRVHVLMLHRRQDPGYEYPNYTTAAYSTLATAYYHYFRDPATGVWTQRRIPPEVYPVGSRPKIGYDANGNVYAAYVSYPAGTAVTPGLSSGKLVIASASKASQYNDWEIVQVNNAAFDGEPLMDQARLLADNILSVYIQEHSPTTTVVGTPLHVFDFAVGVTPPNPLSLDFFGPDSVITFAAPAGHIYQLQSSSSLSPASWANVGSAMSGVNAPVSLVDPEGRLAGRRFYRVIQDP
jgi:hypothetical protein